MCLKLQIIFFCFCNIFSLFKKIFIKNLKNPLSVTVISTDIDNNIVTIDNNQQDVLH